MFYGLRFSRQIGGKFITVWYPPNPTSARFDGPSSYFLQNIFDLDRYRSQVNDDLVLYDGPHPHLRCTKWPNLEGPEFAQMRPDKFDRSYFFNRNVETYTNRFPFYQFSDEMKSRADIISEVSTLFRSMPQTVAVQEALKKARSLIGTEQFIAVHVRRSDVGDWLQSAMLQFADGGVTPGRFRYVVENFVTRAAPPEAYFTEVAAAISAKRKIVFTSDVPDAITPFQEHFGPEHFVDLSTLVKVAYPIQKAFCDFNILTLADKVVSTGSIFAHSATLFGNSKLVNVALHSSVEEIESFAVDLLTPQLAGERKMREALSREIEKSYASRKLARTGKVARSVIQEVRRSAPPVSRQ